MRTETLTLAAALDVLARDIRSEDGVANAAIAEAAQRLRELEWEVARHMALLRHTESAQVSSEDRAAAAKFFADHFNPSKETS